MAQHQSSALHWEYIAIAVAVFVIALSMIGISAYQTEAQMAVLGSRTVDLSRGTVAGAHTERMIVGIDYGDRTTAMINIEAEAMTIAKLLQAVRTEHDIGVRLAYDSDGVSISAINGIAAYPPANTWHVFVNNVRVTGSLDTVVVRAGDYINLIFADVYSTE